MNKITLKKKFEIIYNLIIGKNIRANNTLANIINGNQLIKIGEDESPEKYKFSNHIKKSNLVRQGYFKYRDIEFNEENIYTCAFGEKGKKIEENKYNNNSKILCFSDSSQINGMVNIIKPIFWNPNHKIMSLFHKYMAVSCNYSNINKKFIWIDSRIIVSPEIELEIYEKLDEHPLILFNHYERDNIYDELNAIHKANRAPSSQISEASRFFNSISFDSSILFETGVMGFKLTEEVISLFTDVYGFCNQFIARDQIALPYLLSTRKIQYHLFNNGDTNLRNTQGIEVKKW